MKKAGAMSIRAVVLAAAVILFVCASVTRSLSGDLNIIRLADIKPGMKGVGKTVFKGTEISDFPIEVMGIVPGGIGGSDMILVRVSGHELETNGGVAMGMSGSPIYIDGKLAGALSSTFPDSDHMLAGVTPIESMIAQYDYLEKQSNTRIYPPVKIGDKTYSYVDFSGTAAGDGVLRGKTAVAPILIRGLNKRSYDVLKPFFKASGVDTLPLVGMPAGPSKRGATGIGSGDVFKPGSAVAIQLVRGDMDISAVGTITAIDGDKVLMFGHPFFNKGKINYMIADANVLAIVNDRNAPYKMTTSGITRGIAVQDRGTAVLGYLDKYPKLIPVKVTVEDQDVGRTKEVNVDIVQDNDLMSNLVVAVLVNTLDSSINRVGPGTSKMKFTVKTRGLNLKMERKNTYYSSNDISADSVFELMMAMSMLQGNYFKEVEILGLDINVQVNSKRTQATIIDAKLVGHDKDADTATDTVSTDKSDAADKDKSGKSDEIHKDKAPAETPGNNNGSGDDNGSLNPGDDQDNGSNDGNTQSIDYPSADADTQGDSGSDSGTLKEDNESIGSSDSDKANDKKPDEANPEEDKGADKVPDADKKEEGSGDKKADDKKAGDDSAAKKTADNKDESSGAAKDKSKTKSASAKSKRKKLQKVQPGEKVCLTVKVRPYKKEPVEEKLYLKVPRDIAEGNAVIDIFSGTKYLRSFGGLEDLVFNVMVESPKREKSSLGSVGEGKKEKEKTLEDLMKQFMEHDQNNELVATITSMSASPSDAEDSSDSSDSSDKSSHDSSAFSLDDDSEPPIKDRAKKFTKWVLEGQTSIKVKVEKSGPMHSLKTGKIEKSKISTLQEDGNDKNDKK